MEVLVTNGNLHFSIAHLNQLVVHCVQTEAFPLLTRYLGIQTTADKHFVEEIFSELDASAHMHPSEHCDFISLFSYALKRILEVIQLPFCLCLLIMVVALDLRDSGVCCHIQNVLPIDSTLPHGRPTFCVIVKRVGRIDGCCRNMVLEILKIGH